MATTELQHEKKPCLSGKGNVPSASAMMEEQVYQAITYGNIKRLRQLLYEGFPPEMKLGPNRLSLLDYSCQKGHQEIVELFLSNDLYSHAYIMSKDPSAVHTAAKNGHVEVMALLHNKWKEQQETSTPTCNTFITFHQTDQTNQLVSSGGDKGVPVGNGTEVYPPMHCSSVDDVTESPISLPLSLPYPSECILFAFITDDNGDTPLHHAAANGHISVVEYLLHEAHSSPTLPNRLSQTAIHLASKFGYENIVRVLVESVLTEEGIGPVKDGDGFSTSTIMDSLSTNPKKQATDTASDVSSTTMFQAQETMFQAQEASPFQFRQLSVTSKLFRGDVHGDSPLHLAADQGQLSVVEYFLNEIKCNPALLNEKRQNCLHLAAKNGYVSIVKAVIEALKCSDQVPLLSSGTSHSRDETIPTIGAFSNVPECGTDIKVEEMESTLLSSPSSSSVDALVVAIDSNGDTPIHLAVTHQHLPVVKFLLHNTACSKCVNIKGQNILQLAIAVGHSDVILYLLQHYKERSLDGDHAIITSRQSTIKLSQLKAAEPSLCGTGQANAEAAHVKVEPNELTTCNDKDGNSVLHTAAAHGKLQVVEYLLREGMFNSVLPNNDGHNALHLAAKFGHIDVLRALIQALRTHEDMIKCVQSEKESTPETTTTGLIIHGDFIKVCKPDHIMLTSNGIPRDEGCVNVNSTLCLIDNKGLTILGLAAAHGRQVIIQYAFDELKFVPNFVACDKQTMLHVAARHGQTDIIRYLLERSTLSLTEIDDHGLTPLYLACGGGHLETVKYLTTEKQCDPNMGMSRRIKRGEFNFAPGRTPLHTASGEGHLEVVQFLVKDLKCNPNCTDEDGVTPLFLACQQGHFNIITYFIENLHMNPQLHIPSSLLAAARSGSVDVVRYLVVDKKCSLHCKDSDGNSPVHYAAASGCSDVITFFINEEKCNPMERGNQGRTPLHYASEGKHMEVMKLLVNEHKVDPSCKDENDTSSLHLAAGNGHVVIVKYLVDEKSCDSLCSDNKGRTPLHWAAAGGNLDILHYFITVKQCSSIVKDLQGRTLLHEASEHGHLAVLQYLVNDENFDPSCSDEKGVTPLHLASSKGYLEIVSYLIDEKQCSIMCTDENDDTPLHYAGRGGKQNIIKFLVSDKCCNAMVKNKKDRCPLHFAAEHGHLNIMKYLIDYNADPFVSDKDGITPLHLATESGNLDAVIYLVKEKMCNPFGTCKFEIDLPLKFRVGDLFTLTFTVKASISSSRIPLHWATKHIAIAKYFIDDLQVNPAYSDESKTTLLLLASSDGHEDMVKYLVEDKHCDPLLRNSRGNTALNFAALDGHMDLLKYYINKKHYNPIEEGWKGRTPLHDSCQEGYSEVVKYLVNEGMFDPSSPSDDGVTPLHLAAVNGHIELVKYLIEEKGCNPKVKDKDGDTPAKFAAHAGKWEVVWYFISKEACSSMEANPQGFTALHYFCSKGDLGIVRELIEKFSANPSYSNNESIKPLHAASAASHLAIVEFLINEVHCDHLCRDNDGDTPLHWAAYGGSLDVVQFFIAKKQCNPVERNTRGRTALHHACQEGHIQVVKYLTDEHNVDPRQPDDMGVTPLHTASEKGQLNVITYLVGQKECSPMCNTAIGITPLQLSALKGHWNTLVYYASQDKSSILQEGEGGMTALHHFAQEGDLEMMKKVTCHLQADKIPGTVLHMATSKGNIQVVTFLIEAKLCSPLQKNGRGNTSLNIAALHGHLNILKYYVNEKLCDPMVGGWQERTPLHDACQEGNLHIVKYLTTKDGVNPSCSDCNGQTPLHVASNNGHLGIVKVLVEDFNCNPLNKDKNGATPLSEALSAKQWSVAMHFITMGHLPLGVMSESNLFLDACRAGRLDFMTILFNKLKGSINASYANTDGIQPLHLASEEGNLLMVKFLVETCNCNPLSGTNSGNTCVNCAAQGGHLGVLKYYLQQRGCNPSAKGWQGRTPLHDACQEGQLHVVKYLVDVAGVDPTVQDEKKVTPLHLACGRGHISTVKYLVAEKHCDPTTDIPDLGSPFVWAVAHDREDVAIYLLGKCTVTDASKPGGKVLNLILNEYSMMSPSVKIYIIGDRSSGKSTLTKAICAENATFGSIRNVSGVIAKTAGIVPIDFQSKFCGKLTLYDFAGHEEYYGSHEALFESTSHPVILIAVDLTSENVVKSLKYWLSLISSGLVRARTHADVIIIGSHFDLIKREEQRQRKIAMLNDFIQSPPQLYDRLHCIGWVSMDCRKASSKGMTKLRHLLQESSKVARYRSDYNNKYALILHKYLTQKMSHRKALTFSDLLTAIIDIEDHTFNPLKSPPRLKETCECLNSSGDIIFLKGATGEDDWIILKKDVILTKVHGILKRLKEAPQLASHACIVHWSLIKRIVESDDDVDASLVVEYMLKNEFCSEIARDCLMQSTTVQQTFQERCFFFPELACAGRPAHITRVYSQYTYSFGWTVVCSEMESSFFTPRFLQILLTRLVCRFSIINGGDTSRVAGSSCSIWSTGVHWIDPEFVEVTVEVIEMNTAVIIILRCSEEDPKTVMRCIWLRSQLINEVISLRDKNEISGTSEYVILPQHLKTYPPQMRGSLIPMSRVAMAIVNKNSNIIVDDEQRNVISVHRLLLYEPFQNFGVSLLHSLFSNQNSREEISNTDTTLRNISIASMETWLKLASLLEADEEVIDKTKINKDKSDSEKCRVILEHWSKNGTYSELLKRLGDNSIFSGRNPLVSEINIIPL